MTCAWPSRRGLALPLPAIEEGSDTCLDLTLLLRLRALAKVGVTALIDEATGFQQVREPNALRILVQQYIEAVGTWFHEGEPLMARAAITPQPIIPTK